MRVRQVAAFHERVASCTLARAMVRFGTLFGAFTGFVVQLLFTEWLYVDYFGKHGALEGVIIVASAVSGALIGRWFASRLVSRRRARPV
jgi:hypothetical protein